MRPVAVVPLEELQGPPQGVVGPLPLHLSWSGSDPSSLRWNLDEPASAASFYEILLAEGGEEDQRRWLDRDLLLELWPRLYLPPHVRLAWRDQLPVAAAR